MLNRLRTLLLPLLLQPCVSFSLLSQRPLVPTAPLRTRIRAVQGESAEEKKLRLAALEEQLALKEQFRFKAERAAKVPKKTISEKLRIVFLGKKVAADSGPPTSAIAPFVMPEPTAEQSHPPVSAPPGFTVPKARPMLPTGDLLTLFTALLALAVRLGAGVLVTGWRPRLSIGPPPAGEYGMRLLGPLHLRETSRVLRGEVGRPTGRLILYEFDSSPFCRKVRDACTMLDLTIDVRPCPGAGRAPPNAFSDEHVELHGRMTVPFLIDEGKQLALFESEAIVEHLYAEYGPGADRVPFALSGTFALVSSGTAAIVRGMPSDKLQVDARQDNHLMKPLTFYGYEGSPFAHPCREKLCSLGLPHRVIPCGRGSANRAALTERTDRAFQVPHLIDPNTGVELSESIEIRMYLDRVYTTSGYTPLRGGSYVSELAVAVA